MYLLVNPLLQTHYEFFPLDDGQAVEFLGQAEAQVKLDSLLFKGLKLIADLNADKM